MIQELYSLDDIDPISYSNWAKHDSVFNILVKVVSSITSMIAFLIVQMLELAQHFIHNLIISYNIIIPVRRFLKKIKSNSLVPIYLTDPCQYILVLVIT